MAIMHHGLGGTRGEPVGRRLYHALRERLVTGELVPGARLSETEMASTYGVSRQPVREAFIKLAEERLLEILPQRGTFVSQIDVPAVLSARFVREAVEADIVKLLAERGDGALIVRLRQALREQAAAADAEDPARFLALDEAFHRELATSGGQGASWDILQPLKTQMDRVRHLSARSFPLPALLAQHQAVVDALEARDAAAADAAMRGHLRKIIGDLPQVIEASPDYFRNAEGPNPEGYA
uniref:Transcriptional regulator, GntR family protein n=1 Tax=Aureimonas frigidaquae TaxID=424757 RepID=A0A0N7KY24_9HYPH|nr:transcriptional regulator, GntR family protein [Aureimonas frigidaquae]